MNEQANKKSKHCGLKTNAKIYNLDLMRQTALELLGEK